LLYLIVGRLPIVVNIGVFVALPHVIPKIASFCTATSANYFDAHRLLSQQAIGHFKSNRGNAFLLWSISIFDT